MVACRFGISFLVFNSTSHSFAVLTRELSSQTLEEKFHIYAHPCILLYLSSIKCLLKLSSEELDLSSSGIEFHSPGPATTNVLSPQVFSLAFVVARRC